MAELKDVKCRLVESLDDMLDLQNWLSERRDWLAFDCETAGLNVGRDELRLCQLGDEQTGWALGWDDWKGPLREVMNLYDRRMAAHNSLFDWKFLEREGVHLRSDLVHDTMVMAHIENPMQAIGLKPITGRKYGPMAKVGQSALAAANSKQGWNWSTVPIGFPAYWFYGAMDTVLTAKLAGDLWPKIQPQRIIYDVEMACIRVLRDAELKGMAVDLEYNAQKEAEMRDIMERARPNIPDEIKNPSADKQVLAYLQRAARTPLWKQTEKGNLSCDDTVMAEQEEAGTPGAGPLREWRKARWLVNSHFSNIREMNVDGVVRCSIKPVGARTGRMSITDPALQTIPRGPIVRDAYVAREGHSLISCDYEQLELRVMAYFAQEQEMLRAISNDEDLHDFVAGKLYGEGFTAEQRQVAKNANFSKAFCSGIPTFAHTARIPLGQAEDFIAMYDQMFPGVNRFQQETINEIMNSGSSRTGFVTTILGRKLPVEKDKAYVGVNYRVQSSATADILKLKIAHMSWAGLHDFFRLPVHDELILEAPDDIVQDVARDLQDLMTETDLLPGCKLSASANVGKRWGELK